MTETAIFGGGCFWGVEEIFRKIPGVIDTEVGYCGGQMKNPTYEDVCTGKTDHAEVVKVNFDPAKLSFAHLLDYFFRMHDPTTLNRQHNDIGTQYRSVIFYQSEDQKTEAEKKIKEVSDSKKWPRPIVTQVVPAMPFYSAEAYHQDYLQKNPGGYNCHILRD
jgi:methionine-S-sulfoxide reductase